MTQQIHADLIRNLYRTPFELRLLIRDLPEQSINQRFSADEFSALEHVCHLRDLEVEGYCVRISRIITEDVPLLPDIEGARLAAERDYNTQNLYEALDSFATARRKSLEKLNDLNEQQLNRTAEMEGVGQVTLGRLLEMLLEHDEGHLEELERILRTCRLRSAD